MGDANNALSDAVKVLECEPVKNLVSPSTKEIGEFLGTVANLARFYATDNLERIFKKWATYRNGSVLGAEEFKKVMPLLPLASMVSEDELQEKWAVLMENAATDSRCLPSFGPTLSQLTPDEVRYLDRLWKMAATMNLTYKRPWAYFELINVFDPGINRWISPTEYRVFSDRLTDAEKANYKRLEQARLVVQDLIRLSIIGEREIAEPAGYLDYEGMKVPYERSSEQKIRHEYSFSKYGESFMRAVTREETSSSNYSGVAG
jgi:hypothetical protein